jgi:integrase
MSKRTPGVRRKGNRWEVNVRVNGELHARTFPLDTPMSNMQNWRLAQRSRAPVSGSLSAAITDYLATVTHMPSYADRKRDLETWAATLGGNRPRSAITTQEIDAALSGWLSQGYSPTTVLHRRTALLHLYNRLDGKDVPNPVKRSQRPQEPPPEPRHIPPQAIRRILAAITHPPTRARLAVMATTGLPHKQIGQLTKEMWHGQTLQIPARQKGKGAPARLLQLSPQAVSALKQLDRLKAWGPFDRFNYRRAFRAACAKCGYPVTWRPYDVRHSVATWLYQATGDLATVGRLMGHRSQKTTARYAMTANAELDRAAMRKAGARLAKVGTRIGKRTRP